MKHCFFVQKGKKKIFATLFQGYGVPVEKMPSSQLPAGIEQHVTKDNMVFAHPIDDTNLIAGYGR